MLVYKVTGKLYKGVEWEDFFSDDKMLPKATICVDFPDKIPTDADFHVELADDDWYDGYVRDLTADVAKKVLAKINGVEPEEIRIVEQGESLSV